MDEVGKNDDLHHDHHHDGGGLGFVEVGKGGRGNVCNGGGGEKKQSRKFIGEFLQQSVEERVRRDIGLRPDAPLVEEYVRLPVDEFGSAMLKRMGWKHNNNQNNQNNQNDDGFIHNVKREKKKEKEKEEKKGRRLDLLGLGAKERSSSNSSSSSSGGFGELRRRSRDGLLESGRRRNYTNKYRYVPVVQRGGGVTDFGLIRSSCSTNPQFVEQSHFHTNLPPPPPPPPPRPRRRRHR